MKSAVGQRPAMSSDRDLQRAFTVFSWRESLPRLRTPTHSRLNKLLNPAQLRMRGFYIESWPRVNPAWLESRLSSLRGTPTLTAKRVISRLLLNILLALIDTVAVARRDSSDSPCNRVYCCGGQARRCKRHLFAVSVILPAQEFFFMAQRFKGRYAILAVDQCSIAYQSQLVE